MRVRAYATAQVDAVLLDRARADASGLLAAAGIATEWDLCGPAAACVSDAAAPAITVILTARDTAEGRENCGFAARGVSERRGTIVVSIPCLAGVARRLAGRVTNRNKPFLLMLSEEDLVGAIVAHEIGHLLGLRHGSAGLMRPTLEIADIVALRRGTLRFSELEAASMRVSVGTATHVPSVARGQGVSRASIP